MPEPQQTDHHSMEGLVEHVRTLSLADQVELVRRITPRLLAELDEEDRDELVTHLNQAIVREATSTARR